jgi:hypothetical protein
LAPAIICLPASVAAEDGFGRAALATWSAAIAIASGAECRGELLTALAAAAMLGHGTPPGRARVASRQCVQLACTVRQLGLGDLECWSSGIPRGMMAVAVAVTVALVLFLAPAPFAQPASDALGELLAGKAAFGDWRTDAPLVRRKITDLPPPYATRSASNPPRVIAKPASATPNVPPGFEVELFVSNLRDPRTVRVAPNGDIFIAESEPGRIRVLRAADGADLIRV